MAWSYCEDLEGSCATCGGYAGECKMVSSMEQRNGCAQHFNLTYGVPPSVRDYPVAVMDSVVKVAYTTVHIYEAYEGVKYAQAPLSANYGSSEPVTPFTEYVDRALGGIPKDGGAVASLDAHESHSSPSNEQHDTTPQSTSDPAYINAYRLAAEPFSDWVAGYVWRVCTNGLGLPNRLAQHGSMVFSADPPSRLSQMIRNLLWSTLLQPSGVFLAIWYISRLPVHLDWVVREDSLTPEEYGFRVELWDGTRTAQTGLGPDGDSLETQIVFRLVLLGCMLANKWLDDHTFSNKTWHSITEVPIDSINRLELLALSLLRHDLTISQSDWQDWLSRLRHYEAFNSPFPTPIRRPTTLDPGSVVRNAIEDLLKLAQKGNMKSNPPLPSFSRLLSTNPTRASLGHQPAVDVFEVDLDEDGPLRAEYIPRRTSLHGPRHKPSPPTGFVSFDADADSRRLPPPANWSPQADPPIQRSANIRKQGHNHSRKSSFGETTLVNEPTQWQSITSHTSPNGVFDQLSRADDVNSFNEGCRPPISHTRSTSMMSAFTGPFTAHTRSFSTHALYDNSSVFAAPISLSRNVFSGAGNFGHDDPAHFRPMWLRT